MSWPYSVTISIFRSSYSFVRLKSPAEISQREETSYVCIYMYGCVCIYIYIFMHLARCITSFGRSRRLLDTSRFLFFPFASRFRPSSFPMRGSSRARCVSMHVCIIHAHIFVFERALCSTCRGSLPMHANPVSELSKCTRKCITRGRGNGEGRGERGEEGREVLREAINCGSSRGTVTRPRRRLRNCGCHDIDTSAPTT